MIRFLLILYSLTSFSFAENLQDYFYASMGVLRGKNAITKLPKELEKDGKYLVLYAEKHGSEGVLDHIYARRLLSDGEISYFSRGENPSTNRKDIVDTFVILHPKHFKEGSVKNYKNELWECLFKREPKLKCLLPGSAFSPAYFKYIEGREMGGECGLKYTIEIVSKKQSKKIVYDELLFVGDLNRDNELDILIKEFDCGKAWRETFTLFLGPFKNGKFAKVLEQR